MKQYCMFINNSMVAIVLPLDSDTNSWSDVLAYVSTHLPHFGKNDNGKFVFREDIDVTTRERILSWKRSTYTFVEL